MEDLFVVNSKTKEDSGEIQLELVKKLCQVKGEVTGRLDFLFPFDIRN